MLPLLPVVALTWWVSKQYLHISRELKRLESLKKSPVFVLFSETLQVRPYNIVYDVCALHCACVCIVLHCIALYCIALHCACVCSSSGGGF
jgi:hypothetical protein